MTSFSSQLFLVTLFSIIVALVGFSTAELLSDNDEPSSVFHQQVEDWSSQDEDSNDFVLGKRVLNVAEDFLMRQCIAELFPDNPDKVDEAMLRIASPFPNDFPPKRVCLAYTNVFCRAVYCAGTVLEHLSATAQNKIDKHLFQCDMCNVYFINDSADSDLQIEDEDQNSLAPVLEERALNIGEQYTMQECLRQFSLTEEEVSQGMEAITDQAWEHFPPNNPCLLYTIPLCRAMYCASTLDNLSHANMARIRDRIQTCNECGRGDIS